MCHFIFHFGHQATKDQNIAEQANNRNLDSLSCAQAGPHASNNHLTEKKKCLYFVIKNKPGIATLEAFNHV